MNNCEKYRFIYNKVISSLKRRNMYIDQEKEFGKALFQISNSI